MDPATDVVDTLTEQAVAQAALAPEAGTEIQEVFGAWSATANGVALHGLLPLCMALLMLHEHYVSVSEGRAYRVRYVVVRIAVVAAALLGYGRIVGLITSVAGGATSFPGSKEFLGWIKDLNSLPEYGLGDLGKLLLMWGVVIIAMACSLFAYVAALLLSVAQGFLIALLLLLGKTCIVVSLVPGVGLAKSWAKYLAMVAAWSVVAGAIAHLMRVDALSIRMTIIDGAYGHLLVIAGRFIVAGAALLATPFITRSLFAGAAGAAPGVLGAMALGFMGARMVGRAATGTVSRSRRHPGAAGAAAGGEPAGPGARPHKAPRPPILGGAEAGGGGMMRYEGAAARAYKRQRAAEAARATPGGLPAADIPKGTPGAERFAEDPGVSDRARAEWAWRESAPLADLEAPPAVNPAMRERVHAQHATLRAAYPGLKFDPDRLTPRERALVDELDGPGGRFAGWHRGQQGRGDFRAARAVAERRVEAAALGQAATPRPYEAPPAPPAPAPAVAALPASAGSAPLPSRSRASLGAAGEPAAAKALPPAPAATAAERVPPAAVRSPSSGPVARELEDLHPGPTEARVAVATAPASVHPRVRPRAPRPAEEAARAASETVITSASRIHKLAPQGAS